MRGLRKGGGGRVTGLSPHVPAWEGKSKALEMDRCGYGGGGRGRASNISDRVPQGGYEGVSSGRMSGEGRDREDDAGAFLETAWEGHSDHLGVGKPLLSNIPTMWHVCPVTGPQRPPQAHRDVQEWGGQEETTTGGGRGQGQRGDGL